MFALIAAVALATAVPSPVPSAPQLPTIYHSVSRPLCSSLGARIEPALGLMIQDDAEIQKSVPMFQDYIMRASDGSSDAGRDMAVMHLESLVSPLAKNTIEVQRLLEDPAVFPQRARNDDDKRLIQIKTDMLKTLAAQEAALDIINGFVTTQQLGEMQHAGFGFLESQTVGPNGQADPSVTQALGPTPDPLHRPQTFDDLALQAGLSPNTYGIDPTTIPGLSVGYNPISSLKDGVIWTQKAEKKIQQPLVKAVIGAARSCGAQIPAPSPTP